MPTHQFEVTVKSRPSAAKAESDVRRAISVIPQLIRSAFPDGAVEYCNQRCLESTGLTMEQAQGWGWTDAIHPDDRARLDEVGKMPLEHRRIFKPCRMSCIHRN